MDKVTRVLAQVADRLDAQYGAHERFNAQADPLAVLIETMLSQNTTAANMRRAFEAMRAVYPSWHDVMTARPSDLETVLHPAGLARIRSGRIQRLLRALLRDHGQLSLEFLSGLENAEAERLLRAFEGVGPKTAKCVLLFALRRDVFPVDTHVHRILTRLGIVAAGLPVDTVHDLLAPVIPPGRHLSLHLNLVRHGREVCRPRRPGCAKCTLRAMCSYPDSQSVERG